MAHPILVTGAAGGDQGSTGRRVTELLIERGLPVRAFVHKLDERADLLRKLGADVVQGNLLDLASTKAALQGVKRAYFTYPVDDGLLEATTTFAQAAREAGTELVVNMSQLQNTDEAPSFRNLQHRLADQIFNWANVGVVHLQAPPFFENVRALIAASVTDRNTIFLPWGEGSAVIPLIGAEDIARVAAALLNGSVIQPKNAYVLVSEAPKVANIVSILSSILKRPIQYVEITDEQWAQAAATRINAHAVDHLSHLWRFFREAGSRKQDNLFQVTDAVSKVTGSQPQTLAEFFRLNANAFGGITSAGSAF